MAFATVNPATGETLRTFVSLSPDEIDERIDRARAAFERHRRTTCQKGKFQGITARITPNG